MRPSIAGWFDSRIRIWRTISGRDAVAAETRTYVPVTIYDAAINRSKTKTMPSDAGMQEIGTLRWYGLPGIDVRPRDICEVIAGPDAGHTWEVDAEPVHPRGHHTQVDCIQWNGTLTTDAS